VERGLRRLPAEATHATLAFRVSYPVNPTADAVAVAIVGIGPRGDGRVAHGIEQTEAEQRIRNPQRRAGDLSEFRSRGLRQNDRPSQRVRRAIGVTPRLFDPAHRRTHVRLHAGDRGHTQRS
jgi:hypothetical protein